MAILTKPSVLKGIAAQFSLDKSELSAISLVSNDSYFSDMSNWYRVNVIYKSSPGSQYEIVEFDATQESPVGHFLVSEKARDVFEVLKVKIVDFDGGFLEIPRSSLTVADFDINLAAIPAFLTTLDGSIESSDLGIEITNDFYSHYASYVDGSRKGYIAIFRFKYPSPAEGMVDPGIYKVRFYFDSLNFTNEDVGAITAGFDKSPVKNGPQTLLEFEQNGYVEFEYRIQSGPTLQLKIASPEINSVTFVCSKIEILPLD